MDDAAAKQAFLKGALSEWTPTADDLGTYGASERLYKVDETYTQSLFFDCRLEGLKTMDASKGNKNSVVLSNADFRKAFSLSIDRAECVKSTNGYKPAYALMNNLYFYDVYNDPTSSYRSSDEAMQAVCDLSVVKYFSDRIGVMYYGKMVELATSDELFAHPMHPYTRSLLSAIPLPGPHSEKNRERITYDPLSAHDYSKQQPTMREIEPGHFVYCNDEEELKYKQEFGL